MPSIVLYLLKCQICLAIFWLFYQLFLRKLTFYSMNRWYLLGYVCLSFLLPLVHIVLPDEGAVTGKGQMISYIPVIIGRQAVRTEAAAAITVWDVFLYVLALGALLLGVRLLIRWLSLRRIRKRAIRLGDLPVSIQEAVRKEAVIRGGVRNEAVMVYQVDKPILPFSFGNAIYINASRHTEKELEEIILHEYVHVRQRHTVDILLAELLCILNWYNPFSWLIRHTIRQNLEFIADQQVLAGGMDRKSYQYHLLKVAGEPAYRLANNFNFSSLKKRIIMMNKSKSARLHLVKFLFIVPLLGALLVAFRDKVNLHMSVGRPAVVDKAAVNMDEIVIDTDKIVPGKTDTTPTQILLRPSTKEKPLIIVDEVEFEGELKDVNANDIATVNVLGKAPAFGERGKNGVVLVYRKNYTAKGVVTLKDGTKVKVDPTSTTIGLGKVVRDTLRLGPPTADHKVVGDGRIVRDTLKLGPPVADGKIIGDAVIVRDTVKPVIETRTGEPNDLRKCLFILDGKVSSYDEVFKLSPARIASINILKDKSAEAIYGSRAKEGVVIVATKGPGFKGDATITSIEKGDTITVRADTIQLHPGKD